MKQTLFVASLAVAVASSAGAAVTAYNNLAAWQAAASGAPAGIITAGGAVYANDWSGSYAPTGTGTITFGGGWQQMTAVSTGPALSVAGTAIAVSNGTSLQNVTFTFLANSWGSPHGPTGTDGFYGFGISFNNSTATSIQIVVNNTFDPTNPMILSVSGASGFVGVVVDFGGTKLSTVTFSMNSGQGFDVTGTQFAAVPAPGAAALLGLAGLVGTRRRR